MPRLKLEHIIPYKLTYSGNSPSAPPRQEDALRIQSALFSLFNPTTSNIQGNQLLVQPCCTRLLEVMRDAERDADVEACPIVGPRRWMKAAIMSQAGLTAVVSLEYNAPGAKSGMERLATGMG